MGKVRQFVGNVRGPKGTVFTPHISQALDLSFTNDGDLPNPETVSLKPAPATTSADGLMSAADKAKLDGIPADTATELDRKVNTEEGKGLSSNDFTDADVLTLETAGEKSNAAFSAIDDLLTGLQIPVYKRYISYGSFHLNVPSGGKLDDFHVAAAMAGQTVYVELMAPLSTYFDNENKHCVIDPQPVMRTVTVAADGSVDVRFSLNGRDYYVVVTTTDIAAFFAENHSGCVEPVKILFNCRYTRNTGVFMGLDDIPAVSMTDFADKLGYALRYEQITDMTPEAVATNTPDAVFLYDGSEYYELAATKPSEIPNQNAVYYRCVYRRKEL